MKSPEILAELEARPLEEQLPAESTYGMLRHAADERGDAPALTFLPTGADDDPVTTLSHAELLARIRQTANAFHELGVGPTDVVSTLLPHLAETHEVFWGAQAAGVVNPINFLLRTEEIAELLHAAESRVLVVPGPAPGLDAWLKVDELRARVPSLRHVLRIDLDPTSKGSAIEGRALDFHRLRDAQPGDRLLSGRRIQGHEPAACFHTGGTTGSPKLARHSHRNEVFTAWAFGRLFDLGPDDVMLNGLPMFHVAGTLVCGLAPLAAGGHVVILSPAGMRHPTVVQNYWRIAERWGATLLGGVPTALAALNEVPLDASLHAADSAITGASPLPLEVGRRFEELTGKPVHEILGMTETAGLLALNPRRAPRVLGSAGYRLPFTRVEVRAWKDGEVDDQPCPPGRSGMVVVRGPNVFDGYLDPRHNEGTRTRDGFLITGDLGYQEEDGRLFLTGRAKDVIIRGGHNIDPAWIESAAEAHPDVAAAVAVGRPDPYAGEVPELFVAPRPGTELNPAELLAFVHERIAEPPARPKGIHVVDEIPLTVVGKPFRPELRRRAAEIRLRADVETELGERAELVMITAELDPGGLRIVAEAPEHAEAELRGLLERYALPFSVNGS